MREKRKLDKRLKRNACYHLSHIWNLNSTYITAYAKITKIFIYRLYFVLDENDIYDNSSYQNDFARSDTVSDFGPPT